MRIASNGFKFGVSNSMHSDDTEKRHLVTVDGLVGIRGLRWANSALNKPGSEYFASESESLMLKMIWA